MLGEKSYDIRVAFIIVVVLVLIYEEVIFRGIIFSSSEKYIGFWMANIMQASLFALIHDNMSLFIISSLVSF